MNNELIQILDDLKNIAVDNGDEIVGFIGDSQSFGMLSVGKQIWNYHKERKMKRFLRGLAKKVDQHGTYNQDDKEKLKSFLDVEHTKEKFFGILDEALNSVSYFCSEVLGYFAGDILLSSQKLTYSDYIIINALRNMNDWDIDHFKKAYDTFISFPEDEYSNSLCLYTKNSIKELENVEESFEEILDLEKFKAFKSSLMKITNFQVLNYGVLLMSSDNYTFTRTNISDKLYKLINIIEVQ